MKIEESIIERNCRELCKVALESLKADSAHREIWIGHYGDVLVGDDGKHWVGDLCYMHEKFEWSHQDYMRAYGYMNYPTAGWENENQTNGLHVHEFGGKFILVIRVGHDGDGPLDLCLDTGAVSFVSTMRDSVEAAAEACRSWIATNVKS